MTWRWGITLLSQRYFRYEPFFRSLPAQARYRQCDLLVPELLMMRENDIAMYYAPHNEWLNPHAAVMIVGITPGWSQMEKACRAAREAIARELPAEAVCEEAKAAARFAGTMRDNLVRMLDDLRLPSHLGVPDSRSLFGDNDRLLHTTSLLRYPVFVSGRNYDGHRPELAGHPALNDFACRSIGEELDAMDKPLVIPLGKAVESMLRQLAANGQIAEGQCLWGFPHPSGANGHRHRQFERSKGEMQRIAAAALSR